MHEPTLAQVAAVRAVMRAFRDEDLGSGISTAQWLHCDGCRDKRPLPGAIRYEGAFLCNDCATAYEIARLRRQIGTAAHFIRHLAVRRRPSAPRCSPVAPARSSTICTRRACHAP